MKLSLCLLFCLAVLASFVQGDDILRVFVKSGGCNDPGTGCGLATIRVNGVDYSKQKRGYNVVVVDGATGIVESSVVFDTYSDVHAPGNLVTHLNGISQGKLVLVAIKDEGAALMKQTHYDALIRFGAHNQLKSFRHSYALLGWSGPGELDAVTQVQRDRYKGPSIISKVLNTPL